MKINKLSTAYGQLKALVEEGQRLTGVSIEWYLGHGLTHNRYVWDMLNKGIDKNNVRLIYHPNQIKYMVDGDVNISACNDNHVQTALLHIIRNQNVEPVKESDLQKSIAERYRIITASNEYGLDYDEQSEFDRLDGIEIRKQCDLVMEGDNLFPMVRKAKIQVVSLVDHVKGFKLPHGQVIEIELFHKDTYLYNGGKFNISTVDFIYDFILIPDSEYVLDLE